MSGTNPLRKVARATLREELRGVQTFDEPVVELDGIGTVDADAEQARRDTHGSGSVDRSASTSGW